MILIVRIVIFALIVSVLIYGKLNKYEHELDAKHRKIFSTIKKILEPILELLGKIFKPYRVGQNISIDTSQIALVAILLALLIARP